MMNINQELKWIRSLGGPFILMEKGAVYCWRGTDLDSAYAEENPSDYDRAGELTDYVSKLAFADKEGLVFAMPNDTALLSLSSETVLVVRWVWADSDDQVLDELRTFKLTQDWNAAGIEITFESGEIVLFDSVYDGEHIVESVSAEVEPGCYSVSFIEFQPNPQINLLLFKLERVSD